MEYGMSLKDCSSYNIQFHNGKPILIDTLSFEKYREGEPWIAYRQFCQHFLAPLALMSHKDIRLNQLLRIYIDGIPLDLASSLLPLRTLSKFTLLTHIHLHAKSQKHYADKKVIKEKKKMSRFSLLGIIDNLESAVKGLKLRDQTTEWGNYYKHSNYSSTARNHKKDLVSQFLDETKPKTVWDLGANRGLFSHIAGDKGLHTLAFDLDPVAVEKNYLYCEKKNKVNVLPLVLDLVNPSPGIGWQNQERKSFIERGPADAVLALALIHHLAISNNLPFRNIVELFKNICKYLIIEFIPKSDSQVQKLLSNREDIFFNYTQEKFEREFGKHYNIRKRIRVNDSNRSMYLMEQKKP